MFILFGFHSFVVMLIQLFYYIRKYFFSLIEAHSFYGLFCMYKYLCWNLAAFFVFSFLSKHVMKTPKSRINPFSLRLSYWWINKRR